MQIPAHQPPHSPLTHSLAQIPRISRRRKKLARLISRKVAVINKIATLRLVIGAMYALCLGYHAARPQMHVSLIASVILIPLFIFLVLKTRAIAKLKNQLVRYDAFLDRQLARCSGRPLPLRMSNTESPIPGQLHDLGFSGANSALALFDETLTDSGRAELLQRLSSVLTVEETEKRQKTLYRLRSETWFYTRLMITAENADFALSTSQVLSMLRTPFVPTWLGKAFISVIGLWISGLLSCIFFGVYPPYAIFAFAVVNFFVLGQVGPVFKKGIGLENHLERLEPIFGEIEKRSMQSQNLRELCPTIDSAGPAKSARRLTRALSILGIESNPLAQLLVNVFSPWSITGAFLLERERKQIEKAFPGCLKELSELEIFGSLLILYRFQTQTFAKMRTNKIRARALFHPLLNREKAVANDFAFASHENLVLLTGSNMSGKSTFLRAIGLNQLLANLGAPVFAEEFLTQPMEVGTCIDVNDSLRDGFSYFYSEVRRLKSILDRTKSPEPFLFLIDEIFRGTNNRERHIGSRAVIHTLAQAQGSQGLVTTHDLELTSLNESETSVVNMHFREEIEEGRMVFPYHLNQGPCPTTNALRIMLLEGIPVPPLA